MRLWTWVKLKRLGINSLLVRPKMHSGPAAIRNGQVSREREGGLAPGRALGHRASVLSFPRSSCIGKTHCHISQSRKYCISRKHDQKAGVCVTHQLTHPLTHSISLTYTRTHINQNTLHHHWRPQCHQRHQHPPLRVTVTIPLSLPPVRHSPSCGD